MKTPDPPRHSCECLCPLCEAQGAGHFAQRAALCGDTSAAKRLAPAIYEALTSRKGTLIPGIARESPHGKV